MSRTVLILGLAFLAAACGDKQPATVNDNAAEADAVLAQENVVTADVTAIDAAVADDANMAADMPPPGDEIGNNVAGAGTTRERASGSEGRRAPAADASPADDEPERAAEPAAEGNEA